jgi:TolB-like protein/Tfp pilus assembly protein PilF
MVRITNRDGVKLGRFRLDLSQRMLSRDGTPVRLGSRALDILCVLAAAKGEVVSKDELMAKVWPGTIVEDNNVQVHISALRKVFDDEPDGRDVLVTVPGRGYRLVGLETMTPSHIGSAEDPPTAAIPGGSIAVLAFQNMSGDAEQEYFADGMVEDIITGLSRIKWLFVIARNSSFVYKGKSVDIKQVGRELGVRYVLEGSVRKAGDRVRVTAQLLDAQTGAHLWAERYDRLLDDIFAVQDEVTMSVIGAIEPSLRKIEMERVKRKRPDSLDAYDLVLRGVALAHSQMSDAAAEAIPLLERALELEPDYPVAHAYLGRCYHVRFSRGGQDEKDRQASIRQAHAAIAAGSDDATTLALAGFVIWFDEHEVATAFELFDRALAISSSNVLALGVSAFTLAWMGKTEPAIERARRALRLSPFDTMLPHMAIALASFHLRRYEEARDAARRAVEANPGFSVPHILLAVALARLGRSADAKTEAERVLALDPTFTMGRWSVTVGHVADVFLPIADAWRDLGMRAE